ncbi:MAG: peptidoglycan-binding protein [Leptolyngbya sp. UWPOB_LEPTO1]|uniref:peptidoglycan-binding domain-containing protein n=1 Tax=Leptolyngbya sp. UWPOB_LEPTO1 TaxID=2815653 RepID=UPI001AC4F171|nr:peptidoglycan-binding protein [Leptolyngbya sp. UWPOB_LEPTO1]MBN8561229.1 peptidoglycan-binding protein [Leptolyngbya sp. UWPOB_LEPTO1]
MKMIAYLHRAGENKSPDHAQIKQIRSGNLCVRILSVLMGCAIAGFTQTAMAQELLRKGSSGQAVVELQNRLQELNCYDGSITGYFGDQTETAVIRCQQQFGIEADGIVGASTYNALGIGTTVNPDTGFENQFGDRLRVGDRGSRVQQLQQQLQAAGYYYSEIDGVFGSATQSAVIQLQRDFRLPETGEADASVYAALDRGSVPTSPTNRPGTGLQRGDRGTQVSELQQQLNRLGYSVRVDGIFGASTEAAVLDFQQRNLLATTGEADARTLNQIRQSAESSASLNVRRYVVIVPIPTTTEWSRVLNIAPSATPRKDRLGDYAEVNRYTTPEAAERIAANLRSQGFPDARVIFR